MDSLALIATLVAELVRIAPWWAGFCQPLPQRELKSFEQAHGIRLPDDFRRLLIEVGDRAPIPGQVRGGVLPLAQALRATTASDYLGPLADAFLHSGNKEVRLPWDEEADAYASAPPLRGLLPIGDGGCDLSYHLVVSGKDRGRVWIFAPSGQPELSPTGLDLLCWYRQRLEFGMKPLREAWAERETLEERLHVDNDDVVAAAALGRELLLLDFPRAAALIEQAWASTCYLREEDRIRRLRAVAELDLLQDRWDRIAAMEEEDDTWLRCYAGVSAARAGRWGACERLLSGPAYFPLPMRALASYYQGRALIEAGEHDNALALLRGSPATANIYLLLAQLHAQRGDTGAALRAYRKVRSGHQRHPQWQPQKPTLDERLRPLLPSSREIDAAIAKLSRS